MTNKTKHSTLNSLPTSILHTTALLFFTFSLFPQTAERLEWLLEQERVSYAQAALFVLEAAEHIAPSEQLSPDDAFSYAQENNLLPANVQENYAVNLKGLSFLVMQAFDIKGGVFYSITKSQHHAYRELVHRSIIQGRADPLMYINGDQLLFTINRALQLTGNNEK